MSRIKLWVRLLPGWWDWSNERLDGVGHKPITIPKVVRTRASGLDRKAPHGVIQRLQITVDKGDPLSRVRNLLSKDCWRIPLGDESTPNGPEVARIFKAFLATGDGEWLAGARACPNRSVIGPAGEAEGKAPASEAGEEMALRIAPEVIGADISDASLVNVAGSDDAGRDEIAEPGDCIRFDLVVVGGQWVIRD